MGWFRRRLAAAKADDGLTLVELIVTLVIFAIISAGLLGMASTAYALSAHNRSRVAAAALAVRQIDLVRASDPLSIPNGLTTSTQTVNGITYTIAQNTEFTQLNNSGSACSESGPSTTGYLRTVVSVTWPNMGSIQPVTNSTIDAPKAGTVNANYGNVGVSVVDRNGNPVSGIAVVAPTGSTGGVAGTNLTTGADGCAFFAYLGTGTYTPWLNTAGYVNPLGVTQPSSTVTLTSGNTSSLSFTYDQASSLTLSTDASSTFPVPSTIPFTLYNTNFTNSTKTQIYTGSGFPRTIPGLFPATSGYVPWAGSCADADPTTARVPAVAMTPAANSTSTVHVLPVQINPTFTTTSTAGAWKVVATHASDTSCTSGESYTITSATAAPMQFSLPYGKWSFVATSSKGSSTATVQTFTAATTGTTTFGLVMP